MTRIEAGQSESYEIVIRLAQVYWLGTLITCFCGFVVLIPTTMALINAYPKLPLILKTQWTIIIPQWWVAINYFCIDLYNLTRPGQGKLEEGPWCYTIAYASIFWALSGRQYWALNAYATYRMTTGNPIPDQLLMLYNGLIWVVGLSLSLSFIGQFGPFKGLYCCIREEKYYPWSTFPCFFVTFGSIILSFYYYYLAIEQLRIGGKGATWQNRMLTQWGLAMTTGYYGMWSFLMGNGFFTAVGGEVPPYMDVIAGWMVKTLPVLHGYLLQNTIHDVLHKPKDETLGSVGGGGGVAW